MSRRVCGSIVAVVALATLAGCSSLISGVGFAGARGVIPRAALFGDPERAQARISPDGRWISWVAPWNGVLNVWLAPVEELTAARPLTRERERDVTRHHWAWDSQSILFPKAPGEDEDHHLHLVSIRGGASRDLTPMPAGARAVLLGLSARRPDVALVGMNTRDARLFDVYEITIATGERRLVAENPGFSAWIADHDLAPRLAVRRTAGGGATLARRDGDDGPWTDVLTLDPEDAFTHAAIGFDADGARAFLIDSRDRDTAALVAWDPETSETTVLAHDERADVSTVLTHPQTGEPIAFAVEHARTNWTALDPEYADDIALISAEIDGEVSIVSMTEDANQWVIHADGPQQPGAYALYDREAATVTPLFATRPKLSGARLAPMTAVTILARDGLSLPGYLTVPPDVDRDGDARPDAPRPLVLSVHGGPWARDSYGFDPVHQWLANRGYAVLSVNYRGSRGFGKTFMNAGVGEFAGAMHTDLIDAVDWAIARGVADPNRVAIAGASYGGYAALVGLTFTPERFACGVDIAGPPSLVSLVESFPPFWAPFLDASWRRFVGDPSNVQERAEMLSRSPIARLDALRSPLLIGQGGDDPRVTARETDRLVEALSKRGAAIVYVMFPDEGHGLKRPENRIAFNALAEGFLAQCLGGRAEPVGRALEASSVDIVYGGEFIGVTN